MSIVVSHVQFPLYADLDKIKFWVVILQTPNTDLPLRLGFRLELLHAAPHFVVDFLVVSRLLGIFVEK